MKKPFIVSEFQQFTAAIIEYVIDRDNAEKRGDLASANMARIAIEGAVHDGLAYLNSREQPLVGLAARDVAVQEFFGEVHNARKH